MPTLARTDRWRNLINRMMAARAGGLQDVQTLDDVFPTLSLVDETQGELHFLRGERTWGCILQAIGFGAGNYTIASVANVSTDRLVVVESLVATNPGAATSLVWGVRRGPPVWTRTGVPSTVVGFDSRGTPAGGVTGGVVSGPGSVSAGQDSNAGVSPTASGALLGFLTVAAGATVYDVLKQDVVLRPGAEFFWGLNAANTGADYSVSGYERAAEALDL